MKKVIFPLGILFLFACSKTSVPATPPTPVVQEEAIKFTTNLDTGTYNTSDTLPLVITVSSKLPSTGVIYSVTTMWTDSSKQIFKLDTSLLQSSLSLNIPGLKKSGSYALSISVTSKSTITNTLNKSISVVNNPLGWFQGYKVNSNAKQLGRNYWGNITISAELMLSVFQTSLKAITGHTEIETESVSFGDFNLDGYIDIFNAGGSHNGPFTGFTFLMWNPLTKIFEQKNLFNDKSFAIIGGNPTTIIPYYLNDDNYVDFIIFDSGDEDIPNSPNEPVRYVLSDGKGGYDLKSIETNESEPDHGHRKAGGDIGDIDGDGIPDMVIPCNSLLYIYKGIKDYPYFTTTNRIKYIESSWSRIANLNNKYDIVASEFTNQVFGVKIIDFDKDGKNDIITIGKEDSTGLRQRILLNTGGSWGSNFSKLNLVKLPERIAGKNYEVQDNYIVDIDNDGDYDIIELGHELNFTNWSLYNYKQNSINNYQVSDIDVNVHSASKLIYNDYNNDGIKDIGFRESMGDIKIPKASNSIYNKKVYIKEGNSFVKKSIYDFDLYAKSIAEKYIK